MILQVLVGHVKIKFPKQTNPTGKRPQCCYASQASPSRCFLRPKKLTFNSSMQPRRKEREFTNKDSIRGVALGVEFEIGKGGHLRPLAATCRKRPLAATCQKRPLAATCPLRPLAVTCGHLPSAATCGHLRPLALCAHLRSLAATCPLRSLTVTGQVWSVTCSSGHLRLQVAASDRE